ncbi:tetrapyrrole biosynthesis, uroporphyrinogen III synthase [Lactifluus volemus]|nr:tetrapyrrole biosynthesis, uroporphyrinogen III synthase [Lactifluus volemus]
MAPHVLLLRAPVSPPATDPYEDALARASFRPLSLPVLETSFENLDHLSRIIRGAEDDDRGTMNGVIVTSARAVEACAHAGADIDWRAVRFYAVGPATAAKLAQLPNPPQDVRGTESGTAEQLARYIVRDVRQGERLLYLTGDKNRDTLPRIVREGLGEGCLRELGVYATRGVRDFESILSRALQDKIGRGDGSVCSSLQPALIATIGPTTANYLREEHGLVVEVVADGPNAEALVKGIITNLRDSAPE